MLRNPQLRKGPFRIKLTPQACGWPLFETASRFLSRWGMSSRSPICQPTWQESASSNQRRRLITASGNPARSDDSLSKTATFSKTMKSKPSRDQLCDSLVHIRYTLDQLLATLFWERMESGLRFAARPLTEQETAIYANACIDSSLCSLRILDEFFGKPRKNFITASDYGFRTVGLLNTSDRILVNNHVSHLTHNRTKEPVLEFSKRLITSAFPTCTYFLEHLVESFLKPEDPEMAPVSQELYAFQTARKSFNI